MVVGLLIHIEEVVGFIKDYCITILVDNFLEKSRVRIPRKFTMRFGNSFFYVFFFLNFDATICKIKNKNRRLMNETSR